MLASGRVKWELLTRVTSQHSGLTHSLVIVPCSIDWLPVQSLSPLPPQVQTSFIGLLTTYLIASRNDYLPCNWHWQMQDQCLSFLKSPLLIWITDWKNELVMKYPWTGSVWTLRFQAAVNHLRKMNGYSYALDQCPSCPTGMLRYTTIMSLTRDNTVLISMVTE